MTDVKKLEKQINHVKQHASKFNTKLPGWTVERYFARYHVEFPDLYQRLCKELGIEERY